MFRHTLISFISAVGLASIANAQSSKAIDLFSHIAAIPAAADLTSIRFEKVKPVTIHAKRTVMEEERYCNELAFRDPGGSINCPRVHFEEPTAAYEVTYSYQGPALSSDEYNNHYFMFSVYFRQQDFSPEIRQMFSRGKAARSDAAALFSLKSSADAQQRIVIDEANSNSAKPF